MLLKIHCINRIASVSSSVVRGRLPNLRWHQAHLRPLSNSVPSENVSPKIEIETSNIEFKPLTDDASSFTEFVEPVPIKSLNVRANIETVQKPGSIFNRYFLGTYDKDLLNYPFLLNTRQEFLQMNEQYEMIRATWNKIDKSEETLNLLGFNSLYKLSVSEMMYIFESIGASVQKQSPFGRREDKEFRYEKKMAKSFNVAGSMSRDRFNVPEIAYQSFSDTHQTLSVLLPILMRNSLVYYTILNSSNAALKEKLLNSESKIGFAFCEPSVDQSSNYENWRTEANLTHDYLSWFASGEKDGIIHDDYSHYLVFCRSNDFTEKQTYKEGSIDVGVVALLIPADKVEVTIDYSDYFGIEYQRIKFSDVKIDREQFEVIQSQTDVSSILNIKGCGQLASSALLLGLLKQQLKNTYAYLVNEKLGLTNCELVQHKLFQATSKIYSLESMIYMTAAMFDSFENGANLEAEAITAKTLAIEYGYSVVQELRTIFGSRYPFSSTAIDLIYSFDSFLDSSLQNRLMLARKAFEHYIERNGIERVPVSVFHRASIYSVKSYLKHRRLRNRSDMLTLDMTKYTHHNLHSACEWIESCINRLEYTCHFLMNAYGKDATSKENDLNRLATIGMDIFMMISILSRANHSLCNGIRNNDAEKELCLAICKDTFLRHLQTFEDLNREALTDNDLFAKNVFEQNLKECGYFASLFRLRNE